MNVKGLAYQSRRDQTISEYGEERWNDFFEKFKESNPFFNQIILPTSEIPIEEFIRFQEEIVKEFYNGDEKIYWKFGERSAETSLSEGGPLHIFVKKKGLSALENFTKKILPSIWPIYYDEGRTVTTLKGNIIHASILDLPLYHIYFEYVVMGYIQKGLELIGVPVKETIKVKSSANDSYYNFVLDL